MAIAENKTTFVDRAAVSIGLSQMFSVSASSSDPAYLVLTALDRNEYTKGASGAVGSLSGNGHSLNLSGIGGDGRGAGIVFTYQTASGRYYNATYGYFDQLTYNASGSLDDVTNLSVFGTSNSGQANAYAGNAYMMMQVDAAGYLGSATVVTQPGFTGTVPVQATPGLIASVAASFVGDAWNLDGCWVLASTIAAQAGASLPVQSTAIGVPGQANGEWIVAFNGPGGQSGNWQAMVKAGEMVVIGTAGGGGHITTVVSGAGSTAMLIDNVTYVNGSGQIQNSANDGSSNDIIVAAPHLASQEWAGVQASSVVIYELDTPTVAVLVSSDSLALQGRQALASLFSASDPAGKAITEWQLYDTAGSDSLLNGSVSGADHSAAAALTVASLSGVSLVAGNVATTDTLDVRAYNGSWWGDWQALSVAIGGSASTPPPASAPVLQTQTSGQSWLGGAAVSLVLPTGTFKDPQGQTLRYAASLASGQALPGWFTFNAATQTFSGTAPLTAASLSIKVTATDSSNLSATETFAATVIGAPVVSAATANQGWTEGAAVSLKLAANTFTDPQGQSLRYAATQSNGQALPGWLAFNAATQTFSGTAPGSSTSLGIKVTATDTSGLSTSESFTAAVQPPASSSHPGITVTAPTPAQSWTDGQNVTLTLPANTFTDALGLKMTFIAYELSGPNVTQWLSFNATTDTLSGHVPAAQSGMVQLEVYAVDAQHLTAADVFNVSFAPAAGGHAAAGSDVATGIGAIYGASLQDTPLLAAWLLSGHG
jgi:hypothetical protein